MVTPQELEGRAKQYGKSRRILVFFEDRLGFGSDGRVWETDRKTAIKVFEEDKQFQAELQCYQRLKRKSVFEINGLQVPRLVDFDGNLLIVEMTIVKPPYLLDFGKCYVDQKPPYDDKQLWMEHAKLRRTFKGDYSRLLVILSKLQELGIYYIDARKSNIRFSASDLDESEEDNDSDDSFDTYDELDYDDEQYDSPS